MSVATEEYVGQSWVVRPGDHWGHTIEIVEGPSEARSSLYQARCSCGDTFRMDGSTIDKALARPAYLDPFEHVDRAEELIREALTWIGTAGRTGLKAQARRSLNTALTALTSARFHAGRAPAGAVLAAKAAETEGATS